MKLYAVEHGLPEATVRQAGEETTRIWEMRDIAAQTYESLTPGASASGPYLHVSTIGTIEEFGRWYSSLLEPGLKLDGNLQALAAQILARDLSPQGKVQAVYEAVQRRTKYVAFEFGVHSYQPYSLETVERRGFGDCKDKAAMIVALLRAVGVPAEFAMMRTRSAGDVEPQAYSVQLFNHAVAYVPELNLYVDGTASTLSELPSEDRGALAMTVDAEGKATRRTVPFSPAEANRVIPDVTARLDGAKIPELTLPPSAPQFGVDVWAASGGISRSTPRFVSGFGLAGIGEPLSRSIAIVAAAPACSPLSPPSISAQPCD
jgi:hypothetical protein